MESNSHPIYLSSKAKGEELLKTAKEYTYWEYEDLSLKVYSVGDKEEGIEKPAIIFLHGGAWDISSPEQFIPHCHHFRDGGAVCFTAEYRGALNGMTNPLDAAEDVRNLIVWIRENANIFGVAVNKIVLVGAASGGHAALSSMRRDRKEKKGELLSDPNAMVLLSPIIDTSEKGKGFELFEDKKLAVKSSPVKNANKHFPPMMVMHSKLDRVVKHDSVAKYVRKLNFWKTRCKFISVEGQPHAFFTYNLNHQMYLSTVGEIADFLVELDILAEQNWDTQGEVILEGAV